MSLSRIYGHRCIRVKIFYEIDYKNAETKNSSLLLCVLYELCSEYSIRRYYGETCIAFDFLPNF